MMNRKILVIEDDHKIADLVKLYLTKEGFETVVAHDGRLGLNVFRRAAHSLVILDLMLPELDGISVLKSIRHISNTPIIILSSKDDETDKIIGLELGADDYVVKPFSPKELVARVKTVLRRANQDTTLSRTQQVKNVFIDLDRYEVKKDNQTIPLTRREFDLLIALAQKPGKVYSRLELMEKLYANDLEVYDRTIDVHITNLRKKLNDSNQTIITTVTGIGYKLTD